MGSIFNKFFCFLIGLNSKKKSPIDYSKLLREPGQSLSETIDDILFQFLGILLIFVIISSLLLLKSAWFFPFYLIILMYIVKKYVNKIIPYKLGRDGERAMAQYLDVMAREYAKKGTFFYIYHDIINHKDNYNIDHIVVSKKGIFIIDTKTYTKTTNNQHLITSDGKVLKKNGYTIDPVLPIKGQAKWLKNQLRKKLGRDYEVIPTISFIGWKVEGNRIDNVYITNAKNFKTIVENQFRKEIYGEDEFIRITHVIHELASNTYKKSICY